jgi:hypothetical protein
MRLKIELFQNWKQQENSNGPATFRRQGTSGAFQVSWAEYRGKKPLHRVGVDELRQMVTSFGQDQKSGELVDSWSGSCRFGIFGTAVFRSEENPYHQFWFVTDGTDYIMATHICDREPEPSEVSEVQQIASSLALGPEQPEKPN